MSIASTDSPSWITKQMPIAGLLFSKRTHLQPAEVPKSLLLTLPYDILVQSAPMLCCCHEQAICCKVAPI